MSKKKWVALSILGLCAPRVASLVATVAIDVAEAALATGVLLTLYVATLPLMVTATAIEHRSRGGAVGA